MKLRDRIVITGVGLTCPIGNSLPEYRANLLEGRSGVSAFETRYMGGVLAGVCHYDELRYQKKKEVRRGTRAGSISKDETSQESSGLMGFSFPARHG